MNSATLKAILIVIIIACILDLIGLGGMLLIRFRTAKLAEIPGDSPFIGTYCLGSGINDPYGSPVYQMVLVADGKTVFTTLPRDTNQTIVVTDGIWEIIDNQAVVTFTKQDSEKLAEPDLPPKFVLQIEIVRPANCQKPAAAPQLVLAASNRESYTI